MERKRILIIDDSRTAQMMTSMLLSRGAYAVSTAADGEEGVRKALADPPDLILLDVVMPKMDGFETCRRLRLEPATRGVPIIMMTTRGELTSVEQGYASGCTDYITKPVNNVELLAKVHDCFQG
jgi:DNA-binding response OmpR family regulator